MDSDIEPDVVLAAFDRQFRRNQNLRVLSGDNFKQIKESLRDKGPKKGRSSPSSSGRDGSDDPPMFEPA